jgi:nucleotide-binding universal stress UspA family protein
VTLITPSGENNANIGERPLTVKVQEVFWFRIARDIIAEAQAGYEAVVMGRRGLSAIAEFFIGSVSQKVLHGTKDLSVILVT